jgi:hypothetical protein
LEKALRSIEGVDSTIVDQIMAIGMVNVLDVEGVGAEPLVSELGMDSELAKKIIARCSQEAKLVAAQHSQTGKKRNMHAVTTEQAPQPAAEPAQESAPAVEPTQESAQDEPAQGAADAPAPPPPHDPQQC